MLIHISNRDLTKVFLAGACFVLMPFAAQAEIEKAAAIGCLSSFAYGRQSLRILDTRDEGASCTKDENMVLLTGAGLNWRSDWSPDKKYAVGDAVAYQGSSFIAVKPSKRVRPTNGSMWDRLAGRGDVGVDGKVGPRGEAGVKGADGPKGEAGPTGEKGPVGKAGDNGKAGPKGEPGLEGKIGPRGEAGVAGEKGGLGERGPAGEQGERGQRGSEGERGAKGEPGERGAAGLRGADGPRGAEGSAGLQGPTGETGSQGLQGLRGSVGPTGPQGMTGAVGPEGRTGPSGPEGPRGAQGPSAIVDSVIYENHLVKSKDGFVQVGRELSAKNDMNCIVTIDYQLSFAELTKPGEVAALASSYYTVDGKPTEPSIQYKVISGGSQTLPPLSISSHVNVNAGATYQFGLHVQREAANDEDYVSLSQIAVCYDIKTGTEAAKLSASSSGAVASR